LEKKKLKIVKNRNGDNDFSLLSFWENIPVASIDNFLWMKNYYRPKVEFKVCYSDHYIFLYFNSFEKEIRATYTEINSPVYKDSSVEFFFNPFPNETEKYFNFEINPLGTMLAEFGKRRERTTLPVEEIKGIEVRNSVNQAIKGLYGSDSWEIFCKIPLSLFEKYYGRKFTADKALGNFYKCGDETKFKHYGAWNKIVSKKPDFHLPRFFGELIFEG